MRILTMQQHDEIVHLLQEGAVGAMPTDTVYGVVATANDRQAVSRLYAAKHRERKPGTIIAASINQLELLGVHQRYLQAVSHLWPNSVSVVLPAGPELAYLHQGKDSLAVRLPASSWLRAILLQTGPLLTSSANMPGEPVSRNIEEARSYFGQTLDFYVQSPEVLPDVSSTVVALQPDGSLRLLRSGAFDVPEASTP